MTYSLLKVEAGDYLGLTPAQNVYRLERYREDGSLYRGNSRQPVTGWRWMVSVLTDQADPRVIRRDRNGDVDAIDTHPSRVNSAEWSVQMDGMDTRREAKAWADEWIDR